MIVFKLILVLSLSINFAPATSVAQEIYTEYDPDTQNTYHLFTRDNPYISQPLLAGNEFLLQSSNFNPGRRTIILIHGFIDDITALFNKVLVPAFLDAANVNVIAVDWGVGAFSFGQALLANTLKSGQAGARFINWLNSITGASPSDYHIVGYSMGAHQAAEMARNVNGTIGYVSALDPANGFNTTSLFFTADCAAYTEAIHTYAEFTGYGLPLAHVDFYPNGGIYMPRCDDDDSLCQHESCFFYMAESLSTEFIGQECATYEDARAGNCNLPNTLRMGGLWPKTGSTGLYYLEINSASTSSSCVSFILLLIITVSFISI